MKKSIPFILITLSLTIIIHVFAQNQNEPLILDFNRDFGYGGFGDEIQGRFSLKVTSPQDMIRVEYYLDGDKVFEGTVPPFKWQFNTASFSDGRHHFIAIGIRQDGTEIQSQEFSRVFISSEQAWDETGKIIVPILIIVGITTFGGVLGPILLGRKKEFTPGVYGMAGGAVCPRCTFPYSRGVLAPNLLVGKLNRCPHCGKWAIVPRASASELQVAEERFVYDAQADFDPLSEEDKMRQMLEDSRFEE
jgi:hypothetical protein